MVEIITYHLYAHVQKIIKKMQTKIKKQTSEIDMLKEKSHSLPSDTSSVPSSSQGAVKDQTEIDLEDDLVKITI